MTVLASFSVVCHVSSILVLFGMLENDHITRKMLEYGVGMFSCWNDRICN